MATQLLLIEDVADLGHKGEIVKVRPGYARNFLMPQGFAVVADKRALRMQERLKEERRQRGLVDKKESEEIAAKLEGFVLKTTVKVDHEGHMYGSVSAHDILQLIAEQAHITLEKKNVTLKHAFKELGSHDIHVKLKEGVTATCKLEIVTEEKAAG